MSTGLDCDLLVVGAGPTGMTLALLAARAGLSVIAVDRERDVFPLPRAAHVDHEVMRIFQAVGAADDIAATSRSAARYDFLTADGQVLLRFEGSDRPGAGGWPNGNMIHQPSLERALRRRAPDHPELDLRPGWAFEALEQDGHGVTARLATSDGPRVIRARWLVGADGTRSPVRAALGVEMDDLAFDEPWLVVDAIVHDPARLPDINLQICDPARPTTCVLMGEGRHRWEFMILPGETPDDLLDDARIAALLAPWNVDGAVTLERKAVYRFNARVAKAWRQDRAFLAGDAAHQTPPFAGQGLCSGVWDAANLAWKLAAVAKGEAGPGLLDSYQAERDAPVRAIIGLAMMMGRTVCVTDPDAAATRDAEMLATRAAGRAPSSAAATAPLPGGCVLAEAPAAGHYFAQPVADGTRLDDVLGDGPWLIGACLREPAGLAHAGLTLVALDEPRIAAFRPALAAWLTATGAPAVLVRPDRYVFGAGEPDVLAAAWRRALTA